MGDYNNHLNFRRKQQQSLASIIDANDAAAEALRAEKVAADKQAILAEAYRQMPADMRQRAKDWGVEALMELVWLNGWDCGYRQSMRDHAAIKPAPRAMGAEEIERLQHEITELRRLMAQAHAVMRATGWHLAPGSDAAGDGVLEAAAAEVEAGFRAALREHRPSSTGE